jgi:hypothetical protein
MAYIPLTNQTVSQFHADYLEKLFYKGNILQYKTNSAHFTKNKIYSQLARGLGPNRTKTFATQGLTYTNPNTTGLMRENYTTFSFPNEIIGKPNNISGPFQYDVTSPFNCINNSVQVGGNLICGKYTNQCSGEFIKTRTSQPLCFPSYFSNVPGNPIDLCWNNKIKTWYPKQRYIMNNSLSKWPIGYKGLVSAETPISPSLSGEIINKNEIKLSWNINNNKCIPISSYNIFQNNTLIQNLPYTTNNFTIGNLLINNSYTFFITSLSRNTESSPSNKISINL